MQIINVLLDWTTNLHKTEEIEESLNDIQGYHSKTPESGKVWLFSTNGIWGVKKKRLIVS